MKYIVILLALLSIIQSDDRVNIQVYSESLCPDCTDFYTTSFKKAIETPDFDKICDYQIFPFGNASQKKVGDTWEFKCQHGSNECYGNVMETCAKKYFEKEVIGHWQVCMSQLTIRNLFKPKFDEIGQQCADKVNQNFAPVLECTNSQEGNELEHQMADVTLALSPPHTYVPWIVVNGSHNTNEENQVLDNMLKFACQNYKGQQKIEGCKPYLQNIIQQENVQYHMTKKQCVRNFKDIFNQLSKIE